MEGKWWGIVGKVPCMCYQADTGHKGLMPGVNSAYNTGLMPYFKVEQVLCVVGGEGENTCWVW